LENFGNISRIECVMTLLRSWQQFITDALEYFNTAFDNLAGILTNRVLGTLFQKSK
jgi:hypothetical protein